MTVADRLAEVRARAEKATKGPWKYPHRDWPGVVMSPRGCLWNPDRGEINDPDDAEFIAHARTDVDDMWEALHNLAALADDLRGRWRYCRPDDHGAGEGQAFEEAAAEIRGILDEHLGGDR